jgi:tetratricopeptide (TPR) repeat protein
LVEAQAFCIGDSEASAAVALHARCLVDLQRFQEADEMAGLYEHSVRSLSINADPVHLQMLVLGAKAAVAAGHVQRGLERANLAVESYLRGPSSADRSGLMKEIFKPVGAAQVYMARGEILRRKHDHLGAICDFEQGRVAAFEMGDRRGAAWCLSEIGITWQQLSEFERSERLLQQAAWEAEQVGDQRAAARWRGESVLSENGTPDVKGFNGLATIHRMFKSQGPTEELERLTQEMIRAERGTGTIIEPMARNFLAVVYSEQKNYGLALSAVAAAIAIADELGERWLALSFRCNQAQILFRQGLWVSSEKVCDEILQDVDRLLVEVSSSEIRQAAVSAVSLASEVALVIASGDAESGAGKRRERNPQRVCSIFDRTHGRTLNRWLALMEWSRRAGNPEVVAATRNLLATDLALEWAANAARPVNVWLEKRTQALDELNAVARQTDVAFPEVAGEEPLLGIESHLQRGSAVLALTAVESGIVCLAFECGKPLRTEHLCWGRKDRVAWLDQLRAARAAEACRLGLSYSENMFRAPADRDIGSLYRELRTRFVEPLLKWFRPDVSHLMVALHAELAGIPIWALTYALPELSLSVLPTLRALPLLASRDTIAGGISVALGDATGSLRTASREIELLHDYQCIPPEIEALRAIVPRARRVHFAGHGEFDSDNPYSSGLILRGVNQSPFGVASAYAHCIRLTIPGIVRWVEAGRCELLRIS